MSNEQLNVIALVSGGKDSFFSALHCQRNGHRLVALANLFPSVPVSTGSNATRSAQETLLFKPQVDHVKDAELSQQQPLPKGEAEKGASDDADLNSFMYQTVGHQVIPLYADATGLPLYRQPIYGGAKFEGRDYDSHAVSLSRRGVAAPEADDMDETESMVPLLRTIMKDYPEANALCAGAILSTYQRTRVESVALRLGLTPLAYLWKYPVLPPPISGTVEDAQLLYDMAAAGLDARIIKVASAGLDEEFLWERVSSVAGAARVKRALRRFGAAEGSVLGEGGEFETIVLDGPPSLFRQAIEVPESGRRTVREGGGTSWLSFEGASVRHKHSPETKAGESCSPVRVPDILDPKFQSCSDSLSELLEFQTQEAPAVSDFANVDAKVSVSVSNSEDIHWTVEAKVSEDSKISIEEETEDVVRQIKTLLASHSPPLPTSAIIHTVIVLRHMSDFPAINEIYGRLFQHPNPPSRVTISCGDLAHGMSINIHLTVRPDLEPRERDGLHVQSRSYWAPANIGPYSQAIDVPLRIKTAREQSDQEPSPASVRAVTIAGQIPLVPASMVLPTETTGNLEMQIVLSLQHLWRIAAEMRVQLWTSAVAYFPQTPREADMRRQGQLAAAAWHRAHAADDNEDSDNEGGPDLWDRKYNPEYMSLGEDAGAGQKLPDWTTVRTAADENDESAKPVPPFFAIEVDGLPRQVGVEWHAHLGLSRLAPSSVEYQNFSLAPSSRAPFYRRICHVLIAGALVHTTISWVAVDGHKTQSPKSFVDVDNWMKRAYVEAVGGSDSSPGFPYLIYISRAKMEWPGPAGGSSGNADKTTAFIYARSIWGGNGEEVLAVGLFK